MRNLVRCLKHSKSTRCTFLCLFFVSLILSIINAFFPWTNIETSIYCEVLSTIAGFGIAAIAILFTMPRERITPLFEEKNQNCKEANSSEDMSISNYLDDIFATIATGVLIPLIGLLAYVLCGTSLDFLFRGFVLFFVLFSILWATHITLHFFSLRNITKKTKES